MCSPVWYTDDMKRPRASCFNEMGAQTLFCSRDGCVTGLRTAGQCWLSCSQSNRFDSMFGDKNSISFKTRKHIQTVGIYWRQRRDSTSSPKGRRFKVERRSKGRGKTVRAAGIVS